MKQEIRLPAPLFRDPIYDCPTDPTVIWNREEKKWMLFYTQRRATDVAVGVSWVHGTKIGVAESEDGAKWLYRGTLEGLDIEHGCNTFWAPEIIRAEGAYHMYVSYITGIPTEIPFPVVASSSELLPFSPFSSSLPTFSYGHEFTCGGSSTHFFFSFSILLLRLSSSSLSIHSRLSSSHFFLRSSSSFFLASSSSFTFFSISLHNSSLRNAALRR